MQTFKIIKAIKIVIHKVLNTEEMDARKQVYSHIVEDVLQDEDLLKAQYFCPHSRAQNDAQVMELLRSIVELCTTIHLQTHTSCSNIRSPQN